MIIIYHIEKNITFIRIIQAHSEMSLIEGVGDEVTHFFLGVLIIIVGKI